MSYFRGRWQNDEPAATMDDFHSDLEKDWTGRQLEEMADDLLRQDTNRELCRICEDEGLEIPYGGETGADNGKSVPQFNKDGSPALDEAGTHLHTWHPELACDLGHKWFFGEGKRRDIRGPNPILFEEHLQNRRRREILPMSDEAMGKPDPAIVSGIYNRTHPQGRKVNSQEQRKKNGASFFR